MDTDSVNPDLMKKLFYKLIIKRQINLFSVMKQFQGYPNRINNLRISYAGMSYARWISPML